MGTTCSYIICLILLHLESEVHIHSKMDKVLRKGMLINEIEKIEIVDKVFRKVTLINQIEQIEIVF